MKELSNFEMNQTLKRMPYFELSYELNNHKTVWSKETPDILTLYIPFGKKYFAWFFFYEKTNGIFLIELNREKRISKMSFIKIENPSKNDLKIFYGTIIYGTLSENSFIIEDLLFFKGVATKDFTTLQRWNCITELIKTAEIQPPTMSLKIPALIPSIPQYQFHHIQTRELNAVNKPYINFMANNQPQKQETPPQLTVPKGEGHQTKNFHKKQYLEETTFMVQADISFDMYKLFVYSPNNLLIFYDYAMIPKYETSKKMNELFRTIRENKNIDLIEESDDEEDDYENPNPVKYVDLEKKIAMKCVFHRKFKKWIPLFVANPKEKIINLKYL
jgi:hypothetical protein